LVIFIFMGCGSISMGSVKSSLKSCVFQALHASGVTRIFASAFGVKGVILLFHEIQDDLDSELWTGCPTALFERCIQWLQSAGWDIVPLEEALRRLNSDEPTQPFAVITFDDGYRDNITRALPILRRAQAPFTMYVPTDAITRELYAWWLGLREIFRKYDKVEIAAIGSSFWCPDLASKRKALSKVTLWVLSNLGRIDEFRPIFSDYDISLQSLCDRYFINESELQFLANDPLATIGAHTVTHRSLAALNTAEVWRELTDNRAYLQTCLDRDVIHLAYPFGNPDTCGPREAELALRAGFTTAVTTSNQPILIRRRENLGLLPRVSIHSHWTLAHVDAEISGLTPATFRSQLRG
jgi:peptidoglycan/xylan/chitin deacetylase (PgdA/CDA1 family)